jgi:hypothetical protein
MPILGVGFMALKAGHDDFGVNFPGLLFGCP